MTLPGYIYRLKAGIKHYILEAKQTSSLLNNLREANLKYGFALDAGQLATLECDLITRKVTSNARLKEWLGVPVTGELDLDTWVNRILPDQREYVQQKWNEVITREPSGNFDMTYTLQATPIHKERIVRVKGRIIFNEEHLPSRVTGIMEDVTEEYAAQHLLEESEERARLAIAAGNFGTFDHNMLTGENVLSDRLYELFEVDKKDSNSNTIVANVHPDDRHLREEAWDKAMETGILCYEVRVIRKNHEIRWLRADGKVYADTSGKRLKMVGVVQDITDKKLADQQREEYIALVSHELRNPLTSINLSLALLNDSVTDPFVLELLGTITQQQERILKMTDELLNSSRISLGLLELKEDIFNLKDSLNKAVDLSTGLKINNRITFTGDADINILADRFRIEQVITNLLSNASKYSPAGSEILVHAYSQDSFVHVEVTDKGIGIDEEKLSQVFKKFSRLQDENKIKGYGLGLYISDQIIQKHKGRMWVISQKGKGSTFGFSLPL